ncbi:hypothetical protein [Bradyrhizobium elkanii]|uniref:Uncharacterized protein n=1 Tax=Bradyrhizobium elkanii TaxID=29448 RepID=A0A8I1YG52_BRAEL|nr:hypothetical protein [Bradyrhizobium elkanii]MBP1297581.1 hypothetical protein [Bradyrhizobium elkanii]
MSAKSVVQRGGKRAGAGRKPQGAAPKTVNYNARIGADTLAALKEEADQTAGGSVATLAGWLIEEGLRERKKRKERDPTTKALCFLIAELADLVSAVNISNDQKSIPWRTDPFMFDAFKFAIEGLLRVIRPRGDITSPVQKMPELKGKTIFGPLEASDDRGNWAAILLIRALLTAEDPAKLELPTGLPTRLANLAMRTAYGLADARRDLGFKDVVLGDLAEGMKP